MWETYSIVEKLRMLTVYSFTGFLLGFFVVLLPIVGLAGIAMYFGWLIEGNPPFHEGWIWGIACIGGIAGIWFLIKSNLEAERSEPDWVVDEAKRFQNPQGK